MKADARALTKSIIDKQGYPYEPGSTKQFILWDPSFPGFGMRVYPSGKKTFVVTYRVKEKKYIESIGPYGVLTLDEARIRAKLKFAQVLQGENPMEEKRREARGQRMSNLCDAFMERYSKLHKKSWKLDEQRIRDYIQPAWGSRRIDSITRRDVSDLHVQLGRQYPYLANRVIELLSKMFELAKKWGFLDESLMNPARGIDHFKEEKRDRWVTPDEMPRLAKAINDETNFYASKALWLFLLTGLRKNELLCAKWDDIDFSRRELRVPENKSGHVHYIPLSHEAIALLEQLPRVSGNPYVLPGDKDGSHLVNVDKPWRRVRKAAGVEDVRLHDLRRTVGSWLAQQGNTLHLIGRVLNHKNQATTAIYARFGQDYVAQAMEQHGRRLMEAVNAPTENKVVPIEAATK